MLILQAIQRVNVFYYRSVELAEDKSLDLVFEFEIESYSIFHLGVLLRLAKVSLFYISCSSLVIIQV